MRNSWIPLPWIFIIPLRRVASVCWCRLSTKFCLLALTTHKNLIRHYAKWVFKQVSFVDRLVLRCGGGGELAANLRPPVTVLYPPCPNQMKAADMIQLSVKKRASGDADTRLEGPQHRHLSSSLIGTSGHITHKTLLQVGLRHIKPNACIASIPTQA